MVKSDRNWLILLIAIIGLSVLLRFGVALYMGNDIEELRGGTYDQISYDALALRLTEGYGFSFEDDWWPATRGGEPTAHWSFLYVLSLAGLYELVGHSPVTARLIQSVIVGILTPLFIYRISRRTFNKNAGLAAAGISAIYAYFITYGASLMTESLYIVSILWSIDIAMRLASSLDAERSGAARNSNRHRLILGLELGLAIAMAILLRQVIMAFAAILVLWLIWVAWRRRLIRTILPSLIVTFGVVLLMIGPVIIRNYRAFGRITAINTNSGYALYWSNHPIYGTRFESLLSPSHGVTYQDLIPPELLVLDEAALDRELLGRGLEFIRDEPGRYLLLSLSRIPVYFLFWPKADSTVLSNVARLFSFALFLPAMIYGIVLSVRQFRQTRNEQRTQSAESMPDKKIDIKSEYLLLLFAFILTYSLIHIMSWANVRYRLPVDAILIVFAGYGLWDIGLRIQERIQPKRRTFPAPGDDPSITIE